MRTIGRPIGIAFFLCALAPLLVLVYVSLTEGWRGAGWTPLLLVGMAVVLFLAGRHYFRMNRDGAEQPSATGFSNFLTAHRDLLKALALVGLGLTLADLIATCFGNQPRWSVWPLGLAAGVLHSWGSKIANPEVTGDTDWQRVPARVRGIFVPVQQANRIALLITFLFIAWNRWHPGSTTEIPGLSFAVHLVLDVEFALLYLLEALFFEYGELRTRQPA